MDPNVTLAELRALVEDVNQGLRRGADEFADRFEALDAWLSNGGFRPAAWQRRSERKPDAEPEPLDGSGPVEHRG